MSRKSDKAEKLVFAKQDISKFSGRMLSGGDYLERPEGKPLMVYTTDLKTELVGKGKSRKLAPVAYVTDLRSGVVVKTTDYAVCDALSKVGPGVYLWLKYSGKKKGGQGSVHDWTIGVPNQKKAEKLAGKPAPVNFATVA